MAQRLIGMAEKESIRYNLIQSLIDGKINGTDASKQIGVTVRQVKRMGVIGHQKQNERNNTW